MKVVFLEDVPHVAKAGEIREVSDGYGRNYLLPRKLAVAARPDAINAVKAQLEARVRIEAKTEAELVEMGQQIDGKEVTIEGKTGGKERLYGAITATDIADAITSSLGVTIDKRKIELETPIHTLGEYEIPVRLSKDIVPKVKVKVVEKTA